jgi:hypothetical protein
VILASDGIDSQPDEIVTDSDAVYWVDARSGDIRRLARSGSLGTLVSGASVLGIAVDDQYLYWVNRAGGVRRVLKTGGLEFSVAADQGCSGSCVHDIEVDRDDVYWTNDTSILVVPKAGGTPVLFDAIGLAGPAIAVDGDNVYWKKVVPGTVTYSLEASPKAAPRGRSRHSILGGRVQSS